MENKNLFSNDAAMTAIIKKSIAPTPQENRGNRGSSGGTAPLRTEMSNAVSKRIKTIRNCENIFMALPELETIVSISTASLLSTKDLINIPLIYDSNSKELSLELKSDLIQIVRDFQSNNELSRKLYDWVYAAQRSKGATPVLLVSDSEFDEMFSLNTVASESRLKSLIHNNVKQQLGILEPMGPMVAGESTFGRLPTGPQKVEFELSDTVKGVKHAFFEGVDKDTGFDYNKVQLEFTDNPAVVKTGHLLSKIRGRRARKAVKAQVSYESVGTEYLRKTDTGMMLGDTKAPLDTKDAVAIELPKTVDFGELNPNYHKVPETQLYVELPKYTNKPNMINGFELVLSSAACYPVTLNGDELNPIGFIIPIDDNGGAINGKSYMYSDMAFNSYVNNMNNSGIIINKTLMGLGDNMLSNEISQRLDSKYRDIANNQLTRCLSAGLGGEDISIGAVEEFAKISFCRHLSGLKTQVLYVPAENLPYFATDFNPEGIGVSIVEKSMVISTIRMALLFATMNSAIQNSARHIHYEITPSVDDLNPQESIDRIKSEILNSYNRRVQVWGDMDDMYNIATNSGISFTVADTDSMTTHKITQEDNTPDYKAPDAEYDKDLLRRTCNIADVDPDLVMTPENIEFASQIFSKSLITTQRLIRKQEILSRPITRYVTTSTLINVDTMREIHKKIAESVSGQFTEAASLFQEVERLTDEFFDTLKVKLPSPDTSISASQVDQFDKKVEHIEKLVEYLVTPELVDIYESGGEPIPIDFDRMKAVLKSYYVRAWIKQNDIESDLFDLVFDKETRGDVVKSISDDAKEQAKVLISLSKAIAKKQGTVVRQSGAENLNGDSGGSDYGDDDSSSGDDTGGGDDLNMGDDMDMEADVDMSTEEDGAGDEVTDESSEDGGAADESDLETEEQI